MARKSGNISVLEFGAHAITRLRAKPGANGVDVVAHDIVRGNWNAEDGSLARALREFAQAQRLDEDDVYTIIPRHEATVRILTLPSKDPAEIASMIRFSAEEFVPYGVDELMIGQSILRSTPGGESLVFAALVHRDAVQAHVAMLQDAGIDPAQIYLSTACLASAALPQLPASAEPVAIVSLASSGLEVAVVAGGALRYSRGVASMQDWSAEGDDVAPGQEELAIEVRGTLATARRESEDGAGVDRLFVAAESSDPGPWAEALEAQTAKDCAPMALGADLVASGTPLLKGRPIVALGAALAAQKRARLVIELLPEAVADKRKLALWRGRGVRFAAVAAAVALAFGLYFAQAVWHRNGLIAELERVYAGIAPNARGITKKQEQLHKLRRRVEQNGTALEYLGALCEAAPKEGLNFNRITYNNETGISVFGRAKVLNDIHAYTERLRALKDSFALFGNARSLYENKGFERTDEIFDYQIQIPLTEEKDDEGKPGQKHS